MRAERLLRDAWPLAVLAAAVALLLAGIASLTQERISDNEQRRMRVMLAQMMGLPVNAIDPLAGFAPGERLPARFTLCLERGGAMQRFEFVNDRVAGYGGPIRYLLASHDGEITGMHIVAHSETPGLGDAIEPRRSDWLQQFLGRRPQAERDAWALLPDGGRFDALAGATITSRAVVRGLAASMQRIQETPRDCDHVVLDADRT